MQVAEVGAAAAVQRVQAPEATVRGQQLQQQAAQAAPVRALALACLSLWRLGKEIAIVDLQQMRPDGRTPDGDANVGLPLTPSPGATDP